MANNPAAIPVPANKADDDRWMSMHNRFVRESKAISSRCDVLFIGDSLVRRLEDTELWKTLFSPLGSLNFGISGDSTQHVLWRIQNGELVHIKPKVVVLLVGTNNVGHFSDHSAANISEGIEAILWYIHGINSEIKVLVLGLFPRGENPNPFRVKIRDVNSLLETAISSIPNATFLNADPGFVGADHKISADDMADYLHFTRLGYKKICKTVHEAVLKLLKYS